MSRRDNQSDIQTMDREGTVETVVAKEREGVVERKLESSGVLKLVQIAPGTSRIRPTIHGPPPRPVEIGEHLGSVEYAAGFAALEAGYRYGEKVTYEVIVRVKRKK